MPPPEERPWRTTMEINKAEKTRTDGARTLQAHQLKDERRTHDEVELEVGMPRRYLNSGEQRTNWGRKEGQEGGVNRIKEQRR